MSKLKLFFTSLIFISLFSCKDKIEADILIRNGTVYNGVDTVPTNNTIAIKDDIIVYIGNEGDVNISADRNIDATGLIVCPGFIDPHTHADRDLVDPKKSHNKPFLMQGVTTVTVGNDGSSFFPIQKYSDLYKKNGIGTNVVMLTGHGTIREQIIGKSNKKATEADLAKMKELIQKEMDAGSFGISTGLYYAPGSYSDTEEVIALAKTAAQNDGIYDTHLRDESSFSVGIIAAVEEAIEIGRQAKLPIHISHIKCLGVDVWNKSNEIIKLIEKGKAEGIDITANHYPYDASSTSLKAAVVPRWAESGGIDSLFTRYEDPKLKSRILIETKNNIKRRGGADKLLIVKAGDSLFVGKYLNEISKSMNVLPEEAVFEILEKGYTKVASFNMNTGDIKNFMVQPWVVTGSDGNIGHPRKYGTFTRKYNKYVLENKLIDLATFINGSTSKTAEILKIPNRSKLKEGYYADIVVFNPKTFKDKADYMNAFQFSEGLEYSIINGKLSVENGKYTEKLNGKILTK
ncbi:MAG: amidohydrolase family protein [Bacteroidota bacterium]